MPHVSHGERFDFHDNDRQLTWQLFSKDPCKLAMRSRRHVDARKHPAILSMLDTGTFT